tara:strand:- start:452 stop:694 length:243 start_codon:yes stop_codon:yes gene_type:complete
VESYQISSAYKKEHLLILRDLHLESLSPAIFYPFSPLTEALIWVGKGMANWGPGDPKDPDFDQNQLKNDDFSSFYGKKWV